MTIQVSKHAKQRAWERLGVDASSADEYLNTLFENAEEVYNGGIGRAFECKKSGVVLITDDVAKCIITLYQSKGAQLEEEARENIAKATNAGIVHDEFMRRVLWDNFKVRLKEIEISILEIDVLRESLAGDIARIRRDIYVQEDAQIAYQMLKGEYETTITKRTELSNEHGVLTKQKHDLINQMEKVLGVHLTEYLSFFHEVKRYEREIANYENS